MGREFAQLVSLEDRPRRELIKKLQHEGSGIELVEGPLRRDPDVVLAAVPTFARAVLQAGEERCSDFSFALEAVHRNWRTLELLPKSLRSNRTVVLAAARQHAGALDLAEGKLRGDASLMVSLREGARGQESAKVIPAYEGECLRLVGYCNEWRTSDSRLRFARVAPRLAAEAAGAEEPAEGGEAAARVLAGAGGSDVPPGVARHRLTAHLSHGFLSFQVLSCVHLYACRIYPKAGGQDGFYTLGRKNPSRITAGWGGSGDGHGVNFYIAEMCGSVVNIFVDVYDGPGQMEGSPGLPKVEVWYEVEPGQLTGELPTLAQASDKQKPKMPKREAKLLTLVQDSVASNEVRVLVDPEASKKFEDLVMQARKLSKASYDKRFYIRDLVGSRHLALLVDPLCSRAFGYCIYYVNTSMGELQVEQLIGSESLRGTLLAWVSSQAEASGQNMVERQGETRSDGQVSASEVRRRASLSQPDLPAFVVDRAAGAELRRTRERKGQVYCLLPKGVPIFGERRQGGLVEVAWPVPGCWVEQIALSEVRGDDKVGCRSLGVAELFVAMHRTRLDITGPEPKGQCIVSSHALCVDIVSNGIDRMLGQGPCRVMEGSFHANTDHGVWERHWFVMFGNGTIADVTADQFDEVIQLWWPADATRYALWVGDQHVPLSAIEMGKIGRGIRWATNALGWAPVRN